MAKSNTTLTKFNFFSLRFEPYAHLKSEYTSKKILLEVFSYLKELRKEGKGHLIDRNENRAENTPRELFMVGTKTTQSEENFMYYGIT